GGPFSALEVQSFLDELVAARSDPAAWAALCGPGADGPVKDLDVLRANLAQLDVTLRPAARTHTPTPSYTRRPTSTPEPTYQASLEGAVVHAVQVDWAVPGQPKARQTISLALSRVDDRIVLVGLPEPASTAQPEPLWLRQPIRVADAGPDAVLVAGEGDPQPWLTGLAVSRATLMARRLEPPPITVQLPAAAADFEAVLGVRPGSHRAVAATTWPFGETAHIVVNPESSSALSDPARQVLLTHEAVHVATGAAYGRRGNGPLWWSEGYADLVALAAHPEIASAHEAHLITDQRRHGISSRLVSDQDLSADNARLDAHYARAWFTVRLLDGGAGTADRVQAAIHRGVTLEDALRAEGWSTQTLAAAVEADLTRLAG
ncbi:MAG: hypothetical protein Q4G46_15320, partial [Propionibacteriaceae bacterium]|nr:hypothetical protein [Propionibacteriaceae bacterium]